MLDLFGNKSKKEKVYIGVIIQKIGQKYIVEDKKGRKYFVRSVLPFVVGNTVMVKDDLILNSAKDLSTFTEVVV